MSSLELKNWTTDDILNLQVDLETKTKERFSEKWFYTHFKGSQNKLPRIDMLNLFSRYVGYQNWNDFTQHESHVQVQKQPKRKIALVLVFMGSLITCSALVFMTRKEERNFSFCFYDIYKNGPIQDRLDIEVFLEGESPIQLSSDTNGCFSFLTKEESISFEVSSKYYKAKSITRFNSHHQSEIIRLQSNDYALMLDYFTNSKIDDWNKRRVKLQNLISNKADILQMTPDLNAILQIYDKTDFIRKLSIPTKSLKRIKIIEMQYEADQIVFIRFAEEHE
ncbi:MAG: hypothetical protein MRY83_06485 [Flavobacteriales bacterium]|nr:hypothetical protein [Flavobacteriales bacterium]